MPDMQINQSRLWQRLQDMAAVGATPAGGCNRQALSDEDFAGRQLFEDWCVAAGCTVRRDQVGNVFARRPARAGGAAGSILSGSHLDTQPTGGRYDGVYGVLAALEVVETLNDHDIETDRPVDIVVWTNEEGSRFDCAMMGSAVWSGALPLSDALELRDLDGVSVGEELTRLGQTGQPEDPSAVHAAFELHIEQGPILEREARSVGVVTGVQHMCRYRIRLIGQETHAGPSPMALRRDPMKAAASFMTDAYAIADRYAPGGRVTFGYIHAEPGSPNTVPGRVELTLDLRHPDTDAYQSMKQAAENALVRAAEAVALGVEFNCVWEAPGVTFDPGCVDAVRRAVATTGANAMDIVSGAGHDACNIAAVAPTAMIFIPCDEGLSHNEAENISSEQAAAGANVLLHAVLNASRAA